MTEYSLITKLAGVNCLPAEVLVGIVFFFHNMYRDMLVWVKVHDNDGSQVRVHKQIN